MRSEIWLLLFFIGTILSYLDIFLRSNIFRLCTSLFHLISYICYLKKDHLSVIGSAWILPEYIYIYFSFTRLIVHHLLQQMLLKYFSKTSKLLWFTIFAIKYIWKYIFSYVISCLYKYILYWTEFFLIQ